ncbi:hypothetical protein PRIPAC_72471 [Pristionchus pacificus]|uniref:Large ribosomal subunit protein uL15 n=1 Tax=Pristionchus pacificus TaxID=54126 RepID=A0A2A6C8C0_PRIPA|nr:hypothetical protein PRIPAC_72471 [Pristionchus pacificus]|eukprot:PDM74424.1 ribosomal protein [Pristionchus pacificus]
MRLKSRARSIRAHHQRNLNTYLRKHALLPVLTNRAIDLGQMVGIRSGQHTQTSADIVDNRVLEPGDTEVKPLFLQFLGQAADSVGHDGANKMSTIEEQPCVYASLVLQDDDFERSFFAHSIQTSASMMLTDGYYLTLRQLLVIVKAKFFSHSAEQKIKAAGGTCVLVAKGTITCADSARKLSFEKSRDQHVYKIISTITGVDAFRIAAFLEVGSP